MSGGAAAALVSLTAFVVAGMIVALAVGVRRLGRNEAVRLALARVTPGGGLGELELRAKAKLLLGFYQVAVAMPHVYAVQLPPQYYVAMRAFSWLRFDWLASVSIVHAGDCLSFVARLSVQGLLPLALVAVLLGGVAVTRHLSANNRSAGSGFNFSGLAELALIFFFVFVPTVANGVFSAFVCQGFQYDDAEAGEQRFYLVADLGVHCSMSSPQYQRIVAAALFFVLLWPVGVPALFVAALAISRRYAAHRQLAAFLTREFEPDFFFWEVCCRISNLEPLWAPPCPILAM